MPELVAEWTRACGKQFDACVDWVRAKGIPAEMLCRIGVERVIRDAGLYVPDEAGIPALILPVEEGDSLVDLLALFTNGDWARRTGNGAMLGAESLDCEYCGFGVRVFRTPWSWLRAGGDGVVVLDESAWPQLLWASNIDTDVNGGAKRDHLGGVRRDRLAAAGLSP